jgi:DNA-binding CsgD family transcriptional regulator
MTEIAEQIVGGDQPIVEQTAYNTEALRWLDERVPDGAATLARAAAETVDEDPERAADLYAEALIAGGPDASLVALQSTAAALAGNLDRAMRLADELIVDPDSREGGQGILIASIVLVNRGMLQSAHELCEWYTSNRREARTDGCAAVALVHYGAGSRAAGDAALEVATRHRRPSVIAETSLLSALGVQASLQGPGTDALPVLLRACTMARPRARTVLLPETPASLAVMVAISSGELTIAEDLLRQALAGTLGGPLARPRHLLLRAWTAMLTGDYALAAERVTAAHAEGPLESRDELWANAVTIGIARRTSDATALIEAWPAARAAMVRHPVDLFTLLPLSEYMLAAARMQDTAQVAREVQSARKLLAELGDPPAWSGLFHWAGVQAALLSQQHQAMEPHAAALMRDAAIDPFCAVLANAGRAWTRILVNRIDVEEIEAATAGLQGAGLGWDAARLAGQAAARTTDRKAMVRLLELARSFQTPQRPGQTATVVGAGETGQSAANLVTVVGARETLLSDREQEVARLMLAGQTYREIGDQLYISSKTVEHHVSRMRKRVGAGNRSELFARLRAQLGQTSDSADIPLP